MKSAITFLVPPLAFGLAAVVAWLTGGPAGTVGKDSGNVINPSPRQGAYSRAESGDSQREMAALEQKILHSPAPSKGDPVLAVLFDPDRSREDPLSDRVNAVDYSRDWANMVPDEMFAWLSRQPAPSFGRSQIPAHILFGKWASKDMSEALAAVEKIPDPDIRAQALITSLEVLCKQDPVRARELLMKDLALFGKDRPAPVFDRSGSGESTCDLLLSLPPGTSRTRLLAELLKGMAGNVSDNGKNAARVVWEQSSGDLRHDLVAAGFSSDGDEVVLTGLEELMRERAESSGDPEIADQFINAQGMVWVKRDPAAALDWVQTHLRGMNREECCEWLFETAAGVDFDVALKACRNLPDGMRKIRAAEAVARGASESRKAEARAVVAELSEGDAGGSSDHP